MIYNSHQAGNAFEVNMRNYIINSLVPSLHLYDMNHRRKAIFEKVPVGEVDAAYLVMEDIKVKSFLEIFKGKLEFLLGGDEECIIDLWGRFENYPGEKYVDKVITKNSLVVFEMKTRLYPGSMKTILNHERYFKILEHNFEYMGTRDIFVFFITGNQEKDENAQKIIDDVKNRKTSFKYNYLLQSSHIIAHIAVPKEAIDKLVLDLVNSEPPDLARLYLTLKAEMYDLNQKIEKLETDSKAKQAIIPQTRQRMPTKSQLARNGLQILNSVNASNQLNNVIKMQNNQVNLQSAGNRNLESNLVSRNLSYPINQNFDSRNNLLIEEYHDSPYMEITETGAKDKQQNFAPSLNYGNQTQNYVQNSSSYGSQPLYSNNLSQKNSMISEEFKDIQSSNRQNLLSSNQYPLSSYSQQNLYNPSNQIQGQSSLINYSNPKFR